MAQVVNYTQSSDKFDVIFLDDYPEEVLRQFIGSYSGKVKKGVKKALGGETGPSVQIFEYSAAAFWKAFRGYADHAGYPMKSACVTTSPAHPAAYSEQMPFLQQLPSFGYMLVSSNLIQLGTDCTLLPYKSAYIFV